MDSLAAALALQVHRGRYAITPSTKGNLFFTLIAQQNHLASAVLGCYWHSHLYERALARGR
jgi:hypothetical protein